MENCLFETLIFDHLAAHERLLLADSVEKVASSRLPGH
jgi:hypothetical protein